MRLTISIAAALLLLAACADLEPLGPETGPAAVEAAATASIQSAAAAAPADISGSWWQNRETFIHLVDWAAPMFGIVAEGTRTTLRCVVTGTVAIAQNGTAFTADYDEQGECTTPGGQVVQIGGTGTMDGTISGRSIYILAVGEPGPVECPQRGAIRVVAGAAVEIRGVSHCIEPGHPKSLVQVPAPRAGPNHTNWVWWR
jgi:hypothetical protein